MLDRSYVEREFLQKRHQDLNGRGDLCIQAEVNEDKQILPFRG